MRTRPFLGALVGRGLFVLGALLFLFPMTILATMVGLRDLDEILAGTYFVEAGLVDVSLWILGAILVMFVGTILMVETGFIERDREDES